MKPLSADDLLNADRRLRVATLRSTPNPQQLVWLAMHQCYSENAVIDELDKCPVESEAGLAVIKNLFANDRGHYGPCEHPQITFSVAGYPHSVLQQARTHRAGTSFDATSARYTGKRFIDYCEEETSLENLENIVYLRPVGTYTDRQGKHYSYDPVFRERHLNFCDLGIETYWKAYDQGFSEEHARGLLPFDFRQDFVVSFNMRSLMHFLDLRAKADAQLEIQALATQMMQQFKKWAPEIAAWYEEKRWRKGRLAP